MNCNLLYFLSLIQLGANAKDPQLSSPFIPIQPYSQFNRKVESTYNMNNCLQSAESLAICLNKNKDPCDVSCRSDLPLSQEDDCNSIQSSIASFVECCPMCATESNLFAQCRCACADVIVSYDNCTTLNDCENSWGCVGKVNVTVVESCDDFKLISNSKAECCSSCAPAIHDLALCNCADFELAKFSHATTWTFASGIFVSIFLFTLAL